MLRSFFLPQAGNARSVSMVVLLLCWSMFLPFAIWPSKRSRSAPGSGWGRQFLLNVKRHRATDFLPGSVTLPGSRFGFRQD